MCLSPDVNFHYHIANRLNYFDQNWIIFCIGESICRYARWKFWKGLFANQTHYTRLWICPNVKIQESFCTESFIFILLCDCLNDCLIASLNYCTFLWYFWYISHQMVYLCTRYVLSYVIRWSFCIRPFTSFR